MDSGQWTMRQGTQGPGAPPTSCPLRYRHQQARAETKLGQLCVFSWKPRVSQKSVSGSHFYVSVRTFTYFDYVPLHMLCDFTYWYVILCDVTHLYVLLRLLVLGTSTHFY